MLIGRLSPMRPAPTTSTPLPFIFLKPQTGRGFQRPIFIGDPLSSGSGLLSSVPFLSGDPLSSGSGPLSSAPFLSGDPLSSGSGLFSSAPFLSGGPLSSGSGLLSSAPFLSGDPLSSGSGLLSSSRGEACFCQAASKLGREMAADADDDAPSLEKLRLGGRLIDTDVW